MRVMVERRIQGYFNTSSEGKRKRGCRQHLQGEMRNVRVDFKALLYSLANGKVGKLLVTRVIFLFNLLHRCTGGPQLDMAKEVVEHPFLTGLGDSLHARGVCVSYPSSHAQLCRFLLRKFPYQSDLMQPYIFTEEDALHISNDVKSNASHVLQHLSTLVVLYLLVLGHR